MKIGWICSLLIAAVSSTAQSQAPVALRGTAWDCEGQAMRMPGVRVYALDVKTNRKMLATLRSMDRLDWVNNNSGAMDLLLAKYDSVMNSLKRSRPMGKAVSDPKGRFTFRIQRVDSVLVFGYDEMEDEPVYYSYRVISGRREQSFILDMSRGACERNGKMRIGSPQPSVTNACRNANSWSANEMTYLQRIVTGTDAGNAKLRKAFDLPYVTTAPAVELISDEAQCAAAVTALNSFHADGRSHTPVYLFRVGSTRYVVSDRWSVVHIFDTSYNYKLSMRELD